MAPLLLWLTLAPVTVQASQSFQTVFQQGLEALAAGQLEAAEAAFQEAQRLEPQNPLVHFHLGEIYVQREQFAQAIRHFRQAVQLAPHEPQPYVRLAVLQAQLQRFHDAQQTLNELLRGQPDNPDAHFLFGLVAMKQEEHAQAEQHLREYVRLRPEDSEGLGELGVALLAQDKLQEAEALLLQSVEKNPNGGAAHYNLGLLYSLRAEHEKARRYLETAVQLMPGDAKTHYQLGTVLARLEDLTQAEAAFRKAISLAPDSADAYYALGTLLRRTGRSEETARVLAEHERLSTAALEQRQRDRRLSAYHLDVKTLLEQDRLDEAQKKAGQILELDPGNDLAYYRLAQIFFLRGAYERALETVASAVQRKNFEPAYYLLEAMCWERLGQDDKALLAYERVVSLAEYADAYAALGQLELRRGNTDKAVARLRRAVALEPENPELRLTLADALAKAGRWEESQKQRAEAQALRERATPP